MREHFCVCVQVAEAPAADPRLGRSGEIWHRSRICQARRTRRGEVGRLRISQLEVVSSPTFRLLQRLATMVRRSTCQMGLGWKPTPGSVTQKTIRVHVSDQNVGPTPPAV
jgi:hypothetical protein